VIRVHEDSLYSALLKNELMGLHISEDLRVKSQVKILDLILSVADRDSL
jgi:hypothetical protein